MGNEQSVGGTHREQEEDVLRKMLDQLSNGAEDVADKARYMMDDVVDKFQNAAHCLPKQKLEDRTMSPHMMKQSPVTPKEGCQALLEQLLRKAAGSGSMKILEKLVSERLVALNCVDEKGNTALHMAAFSGQEEAVKFLVRHGAEMLMVNTSGQTPLAVAEDRGHSAIAQYLDEMMDHQNPEDVKSRFRRQIRASNSADVFGPRRSTETLFPAAQHSKHDFFVLGRTPSQPAVSRTSSAQSRSATQPAVSRTASAHSRTPTQPSISRTSSVEPPASNETNPRQISMAVTSSFRMDQERSTPRTQPSSVTERATRPLPRVPKPDQATAKHSTSTDEAGFSRQSTDAVWAEADLVRVHPVYGARVPVQRCVTTASGRLGPLIPLEM